MYYLQNFLKVSTQPARHSLRFFASKSKKPECLHKLAPRCHHIRSLKDDEFDVLVIGGGCVGAGCALDAVTRGLKTALIERCDFGCGTSSKSTKLIHGGVRYLQEAFTKFDIQQGRALREALRERTELLRMAPHLTKVLPTLIPLRK